MDKKQTAMTELRDKMRMKQMTIDQFDSLFQEALAKERQQIEEAFVAGDERGTNNIPFNAEQYFNQTYQ